MGPLDALRHTEQQIQDVARKGAEMARAGIENVEGRVRRRMKVAARHVRSSAHPSADPDNREPVNSKVRTGIVSVNGHDVEKIRCTGGRPA